MAKKRQAVDSAVQAIISGSQKKTIVRKDGTKVLSTRVQVVGVADKFEDAAKELDVKTGALLGYLIEKFLKEWDEGKRPKKKKKTIETLVLE